MSSASVLTDVWLVTSVGFPWHICRHVEAGVCEKVVPPRRNSGVGNGILKHRLYCARISQPRRQLSLSLSLSPLFTSAKNPPP